MYIQERDSLNKILAYLNYNGIFPIKEAEKKLKQLIFNENVTLVSNDSWEGRNFVVPFSEIKKTLRAGDYLKRSFSTVSDQKNLKKAFKHVVLFRLLNSNYIGAEDAKVVARLICSNDKDAAVFVGESMFTQIPIFSRSAPNLRNMGYTKLLATELSLEEKNNVLEEILSYIKELTDFYEENPEVMTSSETLEDSLHRFCVDIFAEKDLFSLYGE